MSVKNIATIRDTKIDMALSDTELILASQSPRRIELLKNIGLTFEVVPSLLEEDMTGFSDPAELVTTLAREKACEVVSRIVAGQVLPKEHQHKKNLIVLGADTIVVLNGKVLGKPVDRADAVAMLETMSGQCHEVFTGVCLVHLSRNKDAFKEDKTDMIHEVSKVYFRKLNLREIQAYIDTGEPMDKAGSYALQGIGSCLVEKIEGCFTNIIGLPLPRVVELLRKHKLKILDIAESDL